MAYVVPQGSLSETSGHGLVVDASNPVGAPEGKLVGRDSSTPIGTRDPYQFLLLLRFTLLNLLAFSLLGVAYIHGLVEQVWLADRTGLSVVIFVVFLGGFGICTRKVWQASRDLNCARGPDPVNSVRASHFLAPLLIGNSNSRGNLADALKLKLAHRIAIVRHVANSLVLLGLIGTVVGFIIALSGVDPSLVSDINSVGPMVATLIDGMSTALYTTLVGAVLNIWLMANHHLLSGGTIKLYTALIEAAERHASV